MQEEKRSGFRYLTDRDFEEVPPKMKFVKYPMVFFGQGKYAGLSTDAKILYTMIRDRQELADRYNDPEPDGRRPVYYTVEEAMDLLNCGNKKAIKTFRELEDWKLITRIRQGQSRPSKIYAKDILKRSYPQEVPK